MSDAKELWARHTIRHSRYIRLEVKALKDCTRVDHELLVSRPKERRRRCYNGT